MERFITTGQAADMLGVSKPTVVRAVDRGLLRPALVTPGRHRRFRLEDVLAFREQVLNHPAEGADPGFELNGTPSRHPRAAARR